MKKNILKLMICALLCTMLLSGCGAAMYDTAKSVAMPMEYNYSTAEMAYDTMAYDNGYGWAEEAEMVTESKAGGNTLTADTSSLSKENLKLIYTANIDIQATDYYATYNSVAALVEQYEGYFESSSVNNDGYYGNGSYMYGYYTVRVPAENYAAFVGAVGNSGYVTSLRENVEDIGLEYYETENRLETLRIKQKRLNELLAQAATMADIIELENALSDCEYNIDMYTSQLNRYDSLVGYSTINISIEKVEIIDPVINKEYSFSEKLQINFNNGVDRFIAGFQDFVLWVTSNVLNILVWAVILLILWLIHPISRIREGCRNSSERRAAKKEQKAARKAGKGGKHVKSAEVVKPAQSAEAVSEENRNSDTM